MYLGRSHIIYLDGPIKGGDFKAFKGMLYFGPEYFHGVYLNSVGGDVLEAIKIGKLIRNLYLRTFAPLTIEENASSGHCPKSIFGKTNCVCYSSCSLLFFAGVERAGNAVGIHRAFMPHKDLAKLSIEQAQGMHKLANNTVKSYLREMEVPAGIIEKIGKIPSKEIYHLSDDPLQAEVGREAPSIEEWLISRCGDVEKALEKVVGWQNTPEAKELEKRYGKQMYKKSSKYQGLSRKYEKMSNCVNLEMGAVRKRRLKEFKKNLDISTFLN